MDKSITYISYLFLCTILVLYLTLGGEEEFNVLIVIMVWLVGSIVYFEHKDDDDDD